ncbi:MAG: hypothetical protein GXP44_02780 [bacterium]|nr:hypothetical protein [bacterium]
MSKNKKIIFASFAAGFALAAFAGGAPVLGATSTDATSTSATTSPSEAVVDTLPSAGLTPLSPFYFLDRVGDWARVNFFFFNPMKRAEVAAEVANERLAELKEVAEKNPQRADIIEELEDEVANRIDKAHGALERLGLKNKKAVRLVRKMENLSLNSQRVMENMLLGNAPKKIKDRTEKSLKRIYKFAEKRRAILLKQKEKGLLSGAEMEKLVSERMERMKRQIERRAARAEKIKDPALKEKIKEMMSEKLGLLEGDVFSVESMGEGESGDIGRKAGEMRKRMIGSILEARKRMMLRGATSTNEILQEMYKGKIDFKERSAELIEKATETISEIKGDLSEMGSTTPKIIRSAEALLLAANRHLTAAKKAFEAEKYRMAFGRAMSAARTSRAAERMLERISERMEDMEDGIKKGDIRDVEDGEKMIDLMRKGRREKMEKEMGERRERLERRSENKRGILKNRAQERGEQFKKQSEDGRNGFLKKKMKERGENGGRAERIRRIMEKRAGESE